MYLDLEYNGVKGSGIQIYARERPSIPAARMRREEITIPGRSGTLYQSDGGYEPTEIEVDFNYIGPEDKWWKRWRKAQEWLSSTNSILRFSDDDGYFYWISYVEVDENERPSIRVGKFTATFITRDGLHYLNSGLRAHAPGDIKWNPYMTSHPVYRITGEGMCTLEVNGKRMTANVGQNLTIDTDRMVAYREDGTLQNTSVTGDYEDLYIPQGDVQILVSAGFDLQVTPNWRCL